MDKLFTYDGAAITQETCYTDRICPESDCGQAGDIMRQAKPPYLPTNEAFWPKSSIFVRGFVQAQGSTKPADAATLSDSIKSVIERRVPSLYFTTNGWADFTVPLVDVVSVVQDITLYGKNESYS
ncbi:hypothetical protein GQ53DRAFT_812945 [Thozetella sp. PMI_491]|nr:hypothetical protein GQ53DRAFT_812945 [Thozetella sp. PMI_491]